MAFAGFGCILAGLGFLIALLIGAVVVRAAVSISNKLIGSPKREPETFGRVEEWEWDDEPEEEHPRRKREKAVPEPGVGKAMMIASTGGVTNAFIVLVIGVFLEALDVDPIDEDLTIAVLAVVSLPFSFVALTLLLTAMLPTTFWRAALVAFVHYALVVVIGIVAGAAIYLAWHAAGG
jgi:hypothetical protein